MPRKKALTGKERILQELNSRFPRVERREGGITASEYAKEEKISSVTARSRLNGLVEKGIMNREDCKMGEGKVGAGQKVYYLK